MGTSPLRELMENNDLPGWMKLNNKEGNQERSETQVNFCPRNPLR